MDLYDPHMVPHTIPWGNYYFPRSTNKIQFFDKIFISGKICQFNERLKNISTKAFIPCGGGSNLILGTGMENQIFILRTPATVKFFFLQDCQKLTTFGFPYLSLKLSLTLPHKGKVLWCLHFRSFLKSTIFSQIWKF